jgi:hypothetical protein
MAKKPIGSIALTGFDDLFNVGVQDGAERITEIALTELYPPDFHPFNVVNDDAMKNLAESIRLYGVREPGLRGNAARVTKAGWSDAPRPARPSIPVMNCSAETAANTPANWRGLIKCL